MEAKKITVKDLSGKIIAEVDAVKYKCDYVSMDTNCYFRGTPSETSIQLDLIIGVKRVGMPKTWYNKSGFCDERIHVLDLRGAGGSFIYEYEY